MIIDSPDDRHALLYVAVLPDFATSKLSAKKTDNDATLVFAFL